MIKLNNKYDRYKKTLIKLLLFIYKINKIKFYIYYF